MPGRERATRAATTAVGSWATVGTAPVVALEQVLDVGPADPDPQVEAVEERSGDAADVPGARRWRAPARPGRAVGSAAAGVHGGDEHEPRREGDRGARPADDDPTFLERLAKVVEHGAGELGQLVEEKNAVVGAADLARSEPGTSPADEGDGRSAVMRGTGTAGNSDKPATPTSKPAAECTLATSNPS